MYGPLSCARAAAASMDAVIHPAAKIHPILITCSLRRSSSNIGMPCEPVVQKGRIEDTRIDVSRVSLEDAHCRAHGVAAMDRPSARKEETAWGGSANQAQVQTCDAVLHGGR